MIKKNIQLLYVFVDIDRVTSQLSLHISVVAFFMWLSSNSTSPSDQTYESLFLLWFVTACFVKHLLISGGKKQNYVTTPTRNVLLSDLI